MRLLTTETRRKLECIIQKISLGEEVSLNQRIELQKYCMHIPYLRGKLAQALRIQATIQL